MLKKIRKVRAQVEDAQETMAELAALLGVGAAALAEARSHLKRFAPPAPQLQTYSTPGAPRSPQEPPQVDDLAARRLRKR